MMIKPCPFCGGEGVYKKFFDGFITVYRVRCAECGVFRDAPESGYEETINYWNERGGKCE